MRTVKFLLLAFFAISFATSYSQMVDIFNKNNIKVNLSSFAFKNISLQYERSVAKHVSVALGFRTEPKGTIPLQSIASNVFDESDFDLNNLKLGNTAITPEVRFYVGRGRNRGFYIAPYGRYANFSLSLPVTYQYNSQTKEAIFDGHINSFSGGVMFGMQYTVARIVVLDIWILGGHYGSSKGNATFTAGQQLSQQEQQALADQLNSISLKPFTFTSTVNASGGTLQSNGPWVGVRALGVNLGIRF
ncbi:MAG TPA: DUF3575 domain-containing protein [Chitinophagaceae bacterium]|nr:DUF3575 domain-containing protein [Chitinophagaceae bacterium]